MREVAGGACVEQVAQNRLLRSLAPGDRAALIPFLEPVGLEAGSKLLSPGEPIRHLHFPRTAIISIRQASSGTGAEVALVGSEGLVGWPALLGCTSVEQGAVVDIQPGTALRLRVEDAALVCRSRATLLSALLRFVEVVLVQIGSTLAAQATHTAQQRVARWILMRHDRTVGDDLIARHDQIASHLSLRRASVTDALHVIEGERFVRCNRRQIQVLDRAGLQWLAGVAYGAAERRYCDTIGSFGKSITPAPARASLDPAGFGAPGGPALEAVQE